MSDWFATAAEIVAGVIAFCCLLGLAFVIVYGLINWLIF